MALLRMVDISKRFGATQALRSVSLELQAGQALALIGENGAGKSTLMKVLSGAHAPDSGQMELASERYAPRGPNAARLAGVTMIYQELNLARDLSVEDNIMLGQEHAHLGVVNRTTQHAQVRAALERLGHADLPLDVPVGRLSVGAQQVVEIARALVSHAKVIVLDEPTSSLTQADVERLFQTISRLRQEGLGIIYISHFLEEIRRVCDSYTVLRDGRTVDSGSLAGTSEAKIVSLMVGRSIDELYPSVPHTPGDALLTVEGISGVTKPHDVSFALRRGEILGLTGLVGAGRTELVRSIFALDPVRSGQIRVAGISRAASEPSPSGRGQGEGALVFGNSPSPQHSPKGRGRNWLHLISRANTPHSRIRAGLAFVSEDRAGEGLAQARSIADNVTYSRMSPYSHWGWLNLNKRRQSVVDWMRKLEIKADSPELAVESLSGGNQQKVALARALHQEADVLLLDEPTRGIDVGTKATIYRLVGELAAVGKSVLFVSSYFPELLRTCDRIGVMSRGRLVEIRPAAAWNEESLLARAIGSE